MQKSKVIGWLILVAIVLIAGWRILSFSNKLEGAATTIFITEAPAEPAAEAVEPQAEEVAFVLDDGSGPPQSFDFEVTPTTTAFGLLEMVALILDIEIEATYYGEMGVFIEAIKGKKNGDEGRYWLYYVNGEMPMKAADKQLVKPGDKVEFRFEESPF